MLDFLFDLLVELLPRWVRRTIYLLLALALVVVIVIAVTQ